MDVMLSIGSAASKLQAITAPTYGSNNFWRVEMGTQGNEGRDDLICSLLFKLAAERVWIASKRCKLAGIEVKAIASKLHCKEQSFLACCNVGDIRVLICNVQGPSSLRFSLSSTAPPQDLLFLHQNATSCIFIGLKYSCIFLSHGSYMLISNSNFYSISQIKLVAASGSRRHSPIF